VFHCGFRFEALRSRVFGTLATIARDRFTCDEKSLRHEEREGRGNLCYLALRCYLLFMLHQHFSTSLETYWEHEYIEGPFMRETSYFGGIALPPNVNVKILIFRCRDPMSLVSIDGPDDCTIGVCFRNLAQPGCQDHSAWKYLSFIYEHFPNCDSILLETEEIGGHLVPE